MFGAFQRTATALLFCATTLPAAATTDAEHLFAGETIFATAQDNILEALISLAGNEQYRQHPAVEQNNATLLDLQLIYGLSSLVEATLDDRARNTGSKAGADDFSRLAWHYYTDHKPVEAIRVLDKLPRGMPYQIADDTRYLRALSYLQAGNFSDAVRLLEEITGDQTTGSYILYNRGVAQLLLGDNAAGAATLAALGQKTSGNAEIKALIDKANITLGYHYLQTGDYANAKQSFNRVQLNGPFTNQALLGAGWASFSMGEIKRAVVPWTHLYQQANIDESVIEAKMALPYAYSKLEAHGKAVNLYGDAIELFDSELAQLDAVIDVIRKGYLVSAIEEQSDNQDRRWLEQMAVSIGSQQTLYLPLLLANTDFVKHANALHDLALVRRKTLQGLTTISSITDYSKSRQTHYAQTQPVAEKTLQSVYREIKALPQPGTVPASGQNAAAGDAVYSELLQRYAQYLDVREAVVSHNLELTASATTLAELSADLGRLHERIGKVITRTSRQLEAVAVDILQNKRRQLASYRENALFALAESYDFATRKHP